MIFTRISFVFIFFVVFLFPGNCIVNNVDSNDLISLEENVRLNTGKIEELEKCITELRKEIKFLKDCYQKKTDEEQEKKRLATIVKKNPEEIIKIACEMIEENKLSEARMLLNLFIKKNPTNIFCGKMSFFCGESYFREENYKDAAREYLNSYTTNSKGGKAADALYKLALCFQKLSKNDKAKESLKKLISDYPSRQDVVSKAKALLINLNNSSKTSRNKG